MSDLATLKGSPPSAFRFGLFADSVTTITFIPTGEKIGTFPDEKLAEAFLYGLIDYRGAVPVMRCEMSCAECRSRGAQ